MRNGFGLRLLHRFLGLPFLRLQRETLLSQLQRNQRETQTCSTELTDFLQSDEADYGQFLDQLSNRRRQLADAQPKTLAYSGSTTSISSASSAAAAAVNLRPVKSIIIGGGQPIVCPGQLDVTAGPRVRHPNSAQPASEVHQSMVDTVGFMSSLLDAKETTTTDGGTNLASNNAALSVDEFCPDGGGGIDRSFLDDELAHNANKSMQLANAVHADDSDSDGDVSANPMVARFHDEPTEQSPPPHRQASDAGLSTSHARAKVNPLAKGKVIDPTGDERSQSTSSDDMDVPMSKMTITMTAADHENTVLHQLRRSPEGLEDPPSTPNVTRSEPFKTVADGDDSDKKSRSSKKKKERNETKAERDVRRAEKKLKRKSKESKQTSDPDEYEAL